MNNKFSNAVILSTFLAVILGGTAGYFMPDFMLSISFIGKLFLNILKIIAIPFALTMIIAGVASMGSREKVKRSLGKTALYFSLSSISASILGAVVALGLQPGVGASKDGAVFPEELIPHLNSFSFNKLFSSLIPDNFLSASLEMQIFGVIIFALLLGAVLTNVDRKNKIVLDFFISLQQMLSNFMRLIIIIAPIGLFSLAGTIFAQNWQYTQMLFSSAALFTATVVFGLSFFALVILPIVARYFTTVSPYTYFTSLIPALTTAFATNSAVATLPITDECVQKSAIDQRASAFVLPLGALFNSAGTSLFLSASAIYIAQMYGLTITIGQILIVIGGSFLIGSLTSFIPYASLLILALVLDIANFPINATAGISILILVDFLFGRLRTVVNVWSDAIGTAILANTFDFKTARSAKAAIPEKRSYSKTNSKTPREYSKNKKEYPKTKREHKPKFTKSSPSKDIAKDAPAKDTSLASKSPFQISTEKNYLSETETTKAPSTDTSINEKSSRKSDEKPTQRHSKNSKPSSKKESSSSSTSNPEVKKQDRPKPIIHKIEVPPLPVVKKREVKPPETKEEVPVAQNNQNNDDMSTAKSSAKISQDTIERERAKIAVQLNQMREKESQIKINKEELEITEKIEPEDLQIKTLELPDNDQFTKIDFYAQDNQEEKAVINSNASSENISASKNNQETANKSQISVDSNTSVSTLDSPEEAPEKTKITNTTPKEEETTIQAEKPVSFGRKSSKKGISKKSSNSDSKSEPVTQEKNDFEVENMSFGRSKRKK